MSGHEYAGIVTLWSSSNFKQYAGGFTVTASSVERFPPGKDVEFVRYGDPRVFIYDAETGTQLVLPAASLAVESMGEGRWRVLMDGEVLLEVEPMPTQFRRRTFDPPRAYKLLARFIRPRHPWPPPPEIMTLPELLARK